MKRIETEDDQIVPPEEEFDYLLGGEKRRGTAAHYFTRLQLEASSRNQALCEKYGDEIIIDKIMGDGIYENIISPHLPDDNGETDIQDDSIDLILDSIFDDVERIPQEERQRKSRASY